MRNLTKMSVVVLLAVLVTIVVGTFFTNTCYVIDTNLTGKYEFDISICRGKLEVRGARMERARSAEIFQIKRGDPILNGLLVRHIGGMLGINFWRNYTTATQLGNGPQVVDQTAYFNALTVDPAAGFIFCSLIGGSLLFFRKRKSIRGFVPLAAAKAGSNDIGPLRRNLAN